MGTRIETTSKHISSARSRDIWRQGHENRIPYDMFTRCPTNVSRREWHNVYVPELIQIYSAFISVIDERYPKHKIKWDNKTFNDFSRMIFQSSSGYISKYLE